MSQRADAMGAVFSRCCQAEVEQDDPEAPAALTGLPAESLELDLTAGWHARDGQAADALLLLDRALGKLPPGSRSAHLLNARGVCHYLMKNFPAALRDFNEAVQLESMRGLYSYNKGNTLLQLGQTEQAFEAFECALVVDPLLARGIPRDREWRVPRISFDKASLCARQAASGAGAAPPAAQARAVEPVD
eukprot:TRINITY_DN29776_c0_g1_i1.p1 TRINITY_DN29776_c0_g1~~TRINITY_DN29776_c0_g1_i1.p1  ORF type:complete len:214 (+),score=53.15 TRINITY_DN29776_c0_g1_i1:75-644(+)